MHPTNRAERRVQRERVIARRRFIHQSIWRDWSYLSDYTPFTEWGRYAKWNLNCGCKGCHRDKYFGAQSRRRKARKSADSTAECRRGDRIVKG